MKVSRRTAAARTACARSRVMLGVFFVFNGLDKLAWFADSGILARRLEEWLQNAAPEHPLVHRDRGRPGCSVVRAAGSAR